MPTSSVFIEYLLRAIYDSIRKHILPLIEVWIIANFEGHFQEIPSNKPRYFLVDKNLPLSIKNPKALEKEFRKQLCIRYIQTLFAKKNFYVFMYHLLKLLQNKKGQKDLGYPRKKQSFSL